MKPNSSSKKIPTDGKSSVPASINDAFGSLHIDDLPQQETPSSTKRHSADSKPSVPAKLGKVSVRIEKSGRSGKTVTVIFGAGITALPQEQRTDLLNSLKRKFACGGTDCGDTLEIQGDERDRVRFFLQLLGFSA